MKTIQFFKGQRRHELLSNHLWPTRGVNLEAKCGKTCPTFQTPRQRRRREFRTGGIVTCKRCKEST